jgi:hypothetical protein
MPSFISQIGRAEDRAQFVDEFAKHFETIAKFEKFASIE